MKVVNNLSLKLILGAISAGTAGGGTYAYYKMRPAPEQTKQEGLLPPSQLMTASTFFDQNQITSQKFVLKCELEGFPSEKKSPNEHKSDNPPSTEHETNTNLHPQEKEEYKEAKPDHFPANSVKLVSDESSGPLETSEFPQKMIILDTLSQDQNCLDLVILSNDDYQLPVMDIEQCEFATISAKQNEIQHRLKPKRTGLCSRVTRDDNRDSKKCDCVKDEVILVEKANEAMSSTTDWFRDLTTQEEGDIRKSSICDNEDSKGCDSVTKANKTDIQKDDPEAKSQPCRLNWLRGLSTPEDNSSDPEQCECERATNKDVLKTEHQNDVFFEILKCLVI